jgi:putative ABC transport system ATP-binding protein
MIEVINVSRIFQSGAGTVVAVKDISFTVPTGSFASIVGTSGSGKTTLLSLLGTLDKPTSGSIEIDGNDITKLRDSRLVPYRRKKIGFIFQGYNLVPNLTALENVMLPLVFEGVARLERLERARSLLDEMGLTASQMGRKPARLSGGQQQRVAIARALANKPVLLLADEPTGNLDSATGKKIFELLHRLAAVEDTTIIAVTHDLSLAKKTDLSFHLQDGILLDKATAGMRRQEA